MEYKYLFKFIIVGDPNIGKSCLLLRFINKEYRNCHDLTIGVEFGYKIINIDNINIKLQIWDTAGQESFKSITRAYYRNTAGAILVYDITNIESFNNIKKWLDDINNNNTIYSIILVGNKIDLPNRVISYNEGYTLAQQYNLLFIETSAKTCINIENIFYNLSKDILQKIENNNNIINPNNGIKLSLPNNTNNNSICCYT